MENARVREVVRRAPACKKLRFPPRALQLSAQLPQRANAIRTDSDILQAVQTVAVELIV